MKFKIVSLTLLVLFAFFSANVFAGTTAPFTPDKIIYVNKAAAAGGDGTTWTKAYQTIQAGLSSAAATVPTTNWGHIVLVKPATTAYTEDLVISNSANNVGLKVMSTDLSGTVEVKGVVLTTATLIYNGLGQVTIKGLTFTANTGQSGALVSIPGTGAGEGANLQCISCYFDIGAVAIDAVDIGAANAITNTVDAFINCTFDLDSAAATQAAVNVNAVAKLTNLTMTACTVNGVTPFVAATGALALNVTPTSIFDGITLQGNTFNYASVLVQLDGGAAADQDNLDILGNFFNLTDGIKVEATAATANVSYANNIEIKANHFALNYTGATAPYAIVLDIPGEMITEASTILVQGNVVDRTQIVTTGDPSANVSVLATIGGSLILDDAILAATWAGNWFGTGGPTAAAAALGNAWVSPKFQVAGATHASAGTAAPAIDQAAVEGIQLYDIDNDGHLDKVVVNFTLAVNPGSLPAAASDGFLMGDSYVISSVHMEDVATLKEVALYLVEKTTFDTGELPQLVFNNTLNTTTTFAGFTTQSVEEIASWQEVGAVEVDVAPPVFIKAETQDVGAGVGTADNGMLDGIKLTFSEAVQNVKAESGNTLTNQAAIIDSNLVVASGNISFNQGAPNFGQATANTYTIPVGETVINTGLIPTIKYDNAVDATADHITDYGKNAVGDLSVNNLYLPGALTEIIITVEDAAAMVVNSVQTADASANGKIDRIIVTFSEAVTMNDLGADTILGNVTFVSTVPAFSSGTAVDGVYDHTSAVVNGAVLTFTITEVDATKYIFDTEAIPTFNYVRASSTTGTDNLVDASGVQLAAYGGVGQLNVVTQDAALPYIVKVETGDNFYDEAYLGASDFEGSGANGRLDTIKLTFSEAVSTAGIDAETTEAKIQDAEDDALAQIAFEHSLTGGAMTQITHDDEYTDGGPVWTSVTTGDGNTIIEIHVKEQAHNATNMVNGGDTGATPETVYEKLSAAKAIVDAAGNELVNQTIADNNVRVADKASPVIIDGLYQYDGVALKDSSTTGESSGWKGKSFPTISTVDTAPTAGTAQYGDGYIDMIELKVSEDLFLDAEGANVAAGTTSSVSKLKSAFSVAEEAGNSDLTVSGVKLKTGDTSIIQVELTNAMLSSTWDTGSRPNVESKANNMGTTTGKYYLHDDADATGDTDAGTYNAAGKKEDATALLSATGDNTLKATVARTAYDGAKPVMVLALGGVGSSTLNITFSELIYSDNKMSDFTPTAGIDGNTIFGYENTNGAGVSGVSATDITESVTTDGKYGMLTITMNTGFIEGDDGDKLWIKGVAEVYDSAFDLPDPDYFNTASGDRANVAIGSLAGGNIRFAITIDTDMPYITSIEVLDTDGNGIVDYLKFTFEENIINSSVTGTVVDGMTADVSAGIALTVTVDGVDTVYDGVLMWNMITSSAAALAAGEPKFADNTVDNNILYLALDEASIPAAIPALSAGNTSYRPVVSFPTAPTMADLSGNKLSLAPATDVDSGLDEWDDYHNMSMPALDKAPPVIMSVQTVSTTMLEMILSEVVTKLDKGDFDWWVGNQGAGQDTKIARIDSTTAGKLVFEVSQANSWNADMGEGLIQFSAGNTLKDMALNNDPPHPSGNDPAPINARLGVTAANDAQATYYKADEDGDPTADPLLNLVQYVDVVDAIVDVVIEPLAAPADLVVTNVDPDNGHWLIAEFTKSADHTMTESVVRSYQFYAKIIPDPEVPETFTWRYIAVIPAVYFDEATGTISCMVPTPLTDEYVYGVCASSGADGTGVVEETAKAAGLPVATLVEDGAARGVSGSAIAATEVAVAASDEIAPSAFATVTAVNNPGSNEGITVNWTKEGLSIVGYYGNATYQLPIYDVNTYEIYRKVKDVGDFALVGTAGPTETSFTHVFDDDVSIFQYYVKAIDDYILANPDVEVKSGTRAVIAKNELEGDFDSNNVVDINDFFAFAAQFDKSLAKDPEEFVSAFDLIENGVIDISDFFSFASLFGTTAGKVAKTVEGMPTSDIGFAMNGEIDRSASMYYVTVSIDKAETLKGFQFTMDYDTSKLEFIEDSVIGLVGLNITRENDGLLTIASMFIGEEFDGTVTIGFKSNDLKSDLEFEILEAMVGELDGVAVSTNLSQYTYKTPPDVYALSRNYPNPFNPTTTIDYSIPEAGFVELAIFNLAGQKVRTLVNSKQDAAYYKVVWDSRNDSGESVASGLYFYRLVSGDFSKIEKMTLIK